MDLIWDINPILFDGPSPLRIYGLLLSIGLIGAFFWWRWQMLRGGHGEDVATYALAYGLGGVILGARLGHYLFYDFGRLVQNPWELLMIWRGGLASHGAFIGLLVALPIYARRNGLSFGEVFDRMTFGGAWGAGWVRLGNLFNSEIAGRPTSQGWGVRFPRYDHLPSSLAPLRHPTQLYEAVLAFSLLGILLGLDRKLRESRPQGLLAAVFLVGYFGSRIIVEEFKAYQALPDSFPLTMGQLLSLLPTLWGLLWLAILAYRRGSWARPDS